LPCGGRTGHPRAFPGVLLFVSRLFVGAMLGLAALAVLRLGVGLRQLLAGLQLGRGERFVADRMGQRGQGSCDEGGTDGEGNDLFACHDFLR